jgi:hypothetical protein
VQLAFSGLVIAGICRYHASLRQVILVQLVLMGILLVFVALPFLIDSLSDPRDLLLSRSCRPVRLIRRMSEDEVIAEFLRSEFHYPAFRAYQKTFRELVASPNLESSDENAKRRALLFLRHSSLWKEIPSDTEWYEAEVTEPDLEQVRAFPRAHWRKLGRGNFSIIDIVEIIRTRGQAMDAPFRAKIARIGERLIGDDALFGAVILIGLNEYEPFTILDGNHRLVAALLASPLGLRKLKFICGLSPRMTECCWYNTNLVTLFRYGKNVLTSAWNNPEAELARLLRRAG